MPQAVRAAGFVPAAPLDMARSEHTATALASGKVLVVGGSNGANLKSAEVYDPASNTWGAAGALTTARYGHTATLLASGKVLVAGGYGNGGFLLTAEIYDPVSNAWSPAAPFFTPRGYHTATLLESGKVLIAGGFGAAGQLATAEAYDPATNSWSLAGTLGEKRTAHAAVRLASGDVLVVGGANGSMVASAELYNPVTHGWRFAAPMSTGRSRPTATVLSSGNVLVVAGLGSGGPLASSEVYDPPNDTWHPGGASVTARHLATATLLPSGRVLVVAGSGPATGNMLASAELFDPTDNAWKPAGELGVARQNHTATLLPSGKVLVVGGYNDTTGVLASAELYDPTTATSIVSISPPATVTGQGYVVVVGITAVSGIPTGSVAVSDGQGASCGPIVLFNGAGSCSLPSAEAGGFVVTATYTPDTGAFAASSTTAHHVVNPADTMLAIVDHTPEHSVPTQSVVVTTALTVVSPGAGTPSGPVTISDGVDSCATAPGEASCALTLATRGPRTLTASYAGDGNFAGSSAQVTHRVNRLPIVTQSSYATNEDVPLAVPPAQGLLAQASDPDGDALAIANVGTLTATGIGGTVMLNADGGFTYTPPAFAHGDATFDYVVGDGYETVTATATIAVNSVNHAPTIVLATLPNWSAGSSGTKTQAGFASVADFGTPNEAGQHVLAWHVRVLGDPNAVASNVTIALDGTLAYTLSGRAGTATFGVKLQDDGGTANGGNDTSDERAFTISVAAGLDLSISIGNDSDFVAGGMPVEYTIVVRNAGPNDAVGAKVKDVLPANLIDAVWSCIAATGASCTPVGSGGIDDVVTIPSGASLTYSLIATVLADPEMEVEHAVSVIAPDGVPDLNTANNMAIRYNTVGVFFDSFDREPAETATHTQVQAWVVKARNGTVGPS